MRGRERTPDHFVRAGARAGVARRARERGIADVRRLAVFAAIAAAVGLGVAFWRTFPAGVGTSETATPSATKIPDHPFGFIDAPASPALTGPKVSLSGWVLAVAGISRVEVHVDDQRYIARHGLPRPDIGQVYASLPEAGHAGFQIDADLTGRLVGRHKLSVIAIDRNGRSHDIGSRTVLAPERLSRWKPLLDARPRLAGTPFYLLPATSGVNVHGADEIRDVYAPYESSTVRSGVRVPILYLRTTKGRAEDWIFDPDWNIDRRCGERRIADDGLASLMAHAVAKQLPVLFTLNGGIWADASCDVPDWDINDELERDPRNCQWTATNQVPADDALRGLAGSQSSPEIGRGLTLNVFADKVRSYKRRNLQAAARIIHGFAARHPDLFVGVSLDPDVYVLPWYAGKEWFDFNPDTIRQFRHWLRGTGPYAGPTQHGTPDLSTYRRKKPLTLAVVRAIAKRQFRTWEDVDPPRTFPPQGDLRYQREWNEPWRLLWDQFRRHLVQLHYSELAEWVIEVGIAPDKVFTAQAFTAPDPGYLPQPIHIEGATTDYDSAGVSVEGAIPRRGRLGVILYGEGTRNPTSTQTGEPKFRIFERMAKDWGVVEFSTANLKDLAYLPTYADAYRAFREITNFGGRIVSPMAWNGSNGIFVGQPGYQVFTSWRNTPAEEAAQDLMLERAHLPAGAKLWTFGSVRHNDDDGWTLQGPGTAVAHAGHLEISGGSRTATVVSPPSQYIRASGYDLVVLGISEATLVESIGVSGRLDASSRWIRLADAMPASALKQTAAGLSIPLRWPSERVVVDQLRFDITQMKDAAAIRIDHVAVYPRERSASRE